MNYMEKYHSWLNSEFIDEETRQELLCLEDEKEIEDRFYKDLDFGTGGLRGILGAGSNRMNKYTIEKSTQGLANYIVKQNAFNNNSVAIAYDSRRLSREFAFNAALVLCANGIKTYVYDELQPTPLLSYTIRKLRCTAGIVVTASHNPPEYNGYKVYWEDGGQVVGNRADEIIEEVNGVTEFSQVKKMTYEEANSKGLLAVIDSQLIDDYVTQAKKLIMDSEIISRAGKNLKIVYTPLHGAGNKLVRRVLSELGFEKVIVVPEQELPDQNFSTVSYPNPEDPQAFSIAISLAKNENADLIIATDPDCDRVGIAVRDKHNNYLLLSGNQTGCLLVNYIFGNLYSRNALTPDCKLITTIVTSKLGKLIASSYGAGSIDTYTGFKYIAREILKMENEGKGKFIFGYEESYGYMPGDFVRDKDAVTASMLICEMAAWYKSRNMTLYDGLVEIWNKFGYHSDSLNTITMHGIEGIEKIGRIMDSLRVSDLKEIAKVKIRTVEDYLKRMFYDYEENKTCEINMEEASDVLRYTLVNGWWFAIRPSGTEPKAKLYFSVTGESLTDASGNMDLFEKSVMQLIDSFERRDY